MIPIRYEEAWQQVEIQAGEIVRFHCNDCESEYDLCWEPQVGQQYNKPPQTKVTETCPFCGGTIQAERVVQLEEFI